MKHCFRIIIGMLLIAIPLCLNAQVKPKKNNAPKPKEKVEQQEDLSRPEKAKPMPVEEAEKEITKPMQHGKPEKPILPDGKGPKVGNDWIPKISGFAQGMYQANFDSDFSLIDNSFSLRRVRLSVDGSLFKGLTYKIQGDFVRSPMLVDAYLKYKVADAFAIQIGQFKTPFSLESPINPLNLEINDYGVVIQKLVGYDDICGIKAIGRDIGVMASGSLFPIKGEEGNVKYHVVEYAVGIFNGNGVNIKDNNNRKDLVGRINVHPGLKDLTLSGSYYNGKYKKDEINQGTRDRWAVGAQYNNGDLVIRAEYLNGYTGYQVAAFNDSVPVIDEQGHQVFVEELRNSKGFYAVAGYNFKLGKEKTQKLMPVVRYDHFVPGDMANEVYGHTDYYTVGVSYWPLKSVNCKLDYTLIQQVIGERTNSHSIVVMVNYKF